MRKLSSSSGTHWLGMLILLATPVAGAQNLVLNPGFESPGVAWELAGPSGYTAVPGFGYSGEKAAAFSSVAQPSTLGVFAQVVPTVGGTPYEVSFWLRAIGDLPTSADPVVFRAGINEIPFLTFDGSSVAGLSEYTRFSFTFTPSLDSTSSIVTFVGRNPFGNWLLDEVSLVASPVPESATYGLMLSGLAAVLAFERRRRRR